MGEVPLSTPLSPSFRGGASAPRVTEKLRSRKSSIILEVSSSQHYGMAKGRLPDLSVPALGHKTRRGRVSSRPARCSPGQGRPELLNGRGAGLEPG